MTEIWAWMKTHANPIPNDRQPNPRMDLIRNSQRPPKILNLGVGRHRWLMPDMALPNRRGIVETVVDIIDVRVYYPVTTTNKEY